MSDHSSVDIENPSKDSIPSTATTQSSKRSYKTWPNWMTKIHLIIITLCFTGGIVFSILFALIPYINAQRCPTKCGYKSRTGFRAALILLHGLINLLIFSAPYFVWYKSYLKKKLHISSNSNDIDTNSEQLPMDRLHKDGSEKSIAQQKFYYSYSINDGPGHQIATLGISVSNILFALIVLMRYQSLLPDNYMLIAEREREDIDIDYGAAKVALFLGLFTRTFASGVPTFPVKKFPLTHYIFTGLMFFVFGAYMVTEVFWIDNTSNGIHYCILTRRGCCFAYWFSFAGIILFGKLDLSALSAVCELLALILQEIYIFSYLGVFRKFDGVSALLFVT